MNHRLTTAAAVAVVLASVSEFALIHGAAWLVEAAGAALVAAVAGTLTRLSPVPAAVAATLLAGAASAPLLAAQSPYWKAAAGVVIIVCAASASGLRPLRAIACPVTYLAALLLYVNALLAGSHSIIGLIPTGSSLHHLVALANSGLVVARNPPPVDGSSHGIQLLAAGSIGLAAIVVDFIAVRLRKPAIAGLPLLVIYLAPIATAAHVGGLGGAATFLLAATGYLALLSSDGRSRLRSWGRVVTVWHAAGEDERLGGADIGALTATGRRIGLAAVCAALVVPLLLPTLSPHKLFGGGNGSGPGGAVTLPDPVDQLHGLLTKSSNQPVFTYRTNGPPQYFQIFVLNYNGGLGDWTIIQPKRSTTITAKGSQPITLQAPPGLTGETPETLVTTHVTLGDVTAGYTGQAFFLPAPYWPVKLQISGTWHEADGTLMLYSDQANHAGQSYAVTDGDIDPTPQELSLPQTIPASIKKAYLGFRSSRTGRLKAIAQSVTEGKTTAFAKAVALEAWFHSGLFSYNVNSTGIPDTAQGLVSFLTTNRQGYCQQFAFAMAVLARLLGIPSRVVIGFTAGQEHGHGTWVVTGGDAHAWPELYFSGAGWVRFEPTPGGQGGQATAFQPSWVTTASRVVSHPSGGTSPGASVSPAPSVGASQPGIERRLQQLDDGSKPGTTASPRRGGAAPIGLAVLALLVLAAATPGTLRLITRRRHWRAAGDDASLARAAWQELCADLEDYGLACGVSESPRMVARRVSSMVNLDEPARLAIGRIATVVERARYAPRPEAAGAIRADVTAVRRSLARGSSRLIRWRARLAPASTLRPLSEALRQGLGLLTGWAPTAREPTPS